MAAQPRAAFHTIEMDVVESGYTPKKFALVRGVPVKWIINGKQITNCNRRIVVPSLELEFDVKPGRQTIEFTPEKPGHIHWSCWMGMLHGDFDVEEEAPAAPPQEIAAASPPAAAAPPPQESGHAEPATHEHYTVVKGDSPWGIAFRLYHDGSRWREIVAANAGFDFRRLRPGQTLRLP